MAGRWLVGWPLGIPIIVGVILNHWDNLADGWDMAGRAFVVLEHPIQQRPDGWVVGSGDFKTSKVYLNRLEVAGRCLRDGWKSPLAISKDSGCNLKTMQDGLEMTCWLAPTNSKDFGCNCRSPRDG